MLNTDEAHALAKWIQNWKKTYKDNPNLNECITWFEWEYEYQKLSSSQESSIATILKYYSEEKFIE